MSEEIDTLIISSGTCITCPCQGTTTVGMGKYKLYNVDNVGFLKEVFDLHPNIKNLSFQCRPIPGITSDLLNNFKNLKEISLSHWVESAWLEKYVTGPNNLTHLCCSWGLGGSQFLNIANLKNINIRAISLFIHDNEF